MQQEFITNSFEETQQVGENFAYLLDGGEVLALYGDLGSGKTTFVQGLAKGLGVVRKVNSPTFIIMREYKVDLQNYPSSDQGESRSQKDQFSTPFHSARTIQEFYHIDLYRIETKKELISLGLHDVFNKPENVVAVEWPEKAQGLLPKKRIEIHFEYLDEDRRKITIVSQ
jgi:tRNA threonylcarbamoyladenosine biosynthesis protein TsaE